MLINQESKSIIVEINNKSLWFANQEMADEFTELFLNACKEVKARSLKAGDKVELKDGSQGRIIKLGAELKVRTSEGNTSIIEVKSILPSIATNRLNYDLTVRAHSGISHSPEYRGYMHFGQFDSNAAKVAKVLTEDVNRVEAFNKFLDEYSRLYAEYLTAMSRCTSTMITGGSNYNVKRHEKNNASERAANERLNEYVTKWLTPKNTSTAISSDDNDAVLKIETKIKELKDYQETMKLINKAYRAFKKDASKLDSFDLSEETKTMVRNWTPAYAFEKAPCQGYEMSNNNANIKRYEQRLEQLRQRDTMQEANDETFQTVEGEVKKINEDNRVKLFFSGKPSASTRSILKSNGFKFAPSTKAWQRQLTTNGIRAAKEVIQQLAA